MAKYTVTMSCGHEQIVELFGKSSEREKTISYYEKDGLCTECYKKMCAEQAKKEGLVFNASILPYIDKIDGSLLISVWFSGDTQTYKDEIKNREEVFCFFPLFLPIKIIH